MTDVDGSVFRVGYAVAKNWTLNGTYFMNKRFIDRDWRNRKGLTIAIRSI